MVLAGLEKRGRFPDEEQLRLEPICAYFDIFRGPISNYLRNLRLSINISLISIEISHRSTFPLGWGTCFVVRVQGLHRRIRTPFET